MKKDSLQDWYRNFLDTHFPTWRIDGIPKKEAVDEAVKAMTLEFILIHLGKIIRASHHYYIKRIAKSQKFELGSDGRWKPTIFMQSDERKQIEDRKLGKIGEGANRLIVEKVVRAQDENLVPEGQTTAETVEVMTDDVLGSIKKMVS